MHAKRLRAWASIWSIHHGSVDNMHVYAYSICWNMLWVRLQLALHNFHFNLI